MRYHGCNMPSWNIHTAHVESLLSRRDPKELGIEDVNTFLFGNFAPDIYVGFMVPEASLRIDYCVTHVAQINMIPVANADMFWDLYIGYRTPSDPSTLSLTLGAWAHLVADRYYNGNFRTYWLQCDIAGGDVQRIAKQADFELFGNSLRLQTCTQATQQLLEAAYNFRPYRILEEDVNRSIDIANAIVRNNGKAHLTQTSYQVLSKAWLDRVFSDCTDRLEIWLETWQRLVSQGLPFRAADIRAAAGLPPATPDVFGWADEKLSKSR